jgi:ribosomal protein L11 methyltransferase
VREAAGEFADQGAEWRAEESRDWIAEAQTRLQPLNIGSRFFLAPAWRSDPTPPGRFRIEVNPGIAFGTGAHESTKLCLEALEREVRDGMEILDVGCGSGILSKAATLLGARRSISCDIDPVAVELARQELSLVGSADAGRAHSVDMIVANISPEAIIALAPEIARCLRTGGVAIVSGFENGEAESVEAALRSSGLALRSSHSKGSWSALIVSS